MAGPKVSGEARLQWRGKRSRKMPQGPTSERASERFASLLLVAKPLGTTIKGNCEETLDHSHPVKRRRSTASRAHDPMAGNSACDLGRGGV